MLRVIPSFGLTTYYIGEDPTDSLAAFIAFITIISIRMPASCTPTRPEFPVLINLEYRQGIFR